jgi:hypothetical protein
MRRADTEREVADIVARLALERDKAIAAHNDEAAARRRADTAAEQEAMRRAGTEKEAADIAARLAAERRRRAKAERQGAEAETRLVEIEVQLSVRDSQIAELRSRGARAEVERDRLRRECEALLGSTFWRLGAPARRLVKVMPSGLRRGARHSARIFYWALTPHRTAERLAYFRARNRQAPSPPVTIEVPLREDFEEAARWPKNSDGFVELCRELLEQGSIARAEHVAQMAKERFPADCQLGSLYRGIAASRLLHGSGLFDPAVYRSLHLDLREHAEPWRHFVAHGLDEGRQFTNRESVARILADMHWEIKHASDEFETQARRTLAGDAGFDPAAALRRMRVRIGVFCNREGNFYMQEIADLLALGLEEAGVDTALRDETCDRDEAFDLRVFVAPHEFFYLGAGKDWLSAAGDANTVLYNVEQMHTPWFCRAFSLLLRAPLVLDINFQSAEILRRAGCNVVHIMPGYMERAPYAQSYTDASNIELLKGYEFSKDYYDWRTLDQLKDRPIDLLFIGSSSPRREETLVNIQAALESHRFVCICTRQQRPLTRRNYRSTSTAINCALGQRSKIVLNIHRDWLGYFEWSRMVLQGFWQGACVVSDPCLPHPIFKPARHYLEESTRHLGELIRWLLETGDGQQEFERVRLAGHQAAVTVGSMGVALAPVIEAMTRLVDKQPLKRSPARGAAIGLTS